jgi:bacteriocin biosynthesis cyclodehydratase domain-containing protein
MSMDDSATLPGASVLQMKDIYEIIVSASGEVPHVRSGDEVVLSLAGDKSHLLGAVLLAVDGRKRVDELAQTLSEVGDEASVLSAVAFLLKQGILEDVRLSDPAVPERWHQQTRYLSHYLPDPIAALETVAATRCRVIGDGEFADSAASVLEAHGFAIVDADVASLTPRDVVVVAAETHTPRLCHETNTACLSLRVPLLVADLSSGNHGIVGPFCIPGDTSCYQCYETRLLAGTNTYEERIDYGAFVTEHPQRRGSFGQLRAMADMAASLVALEVLSYITGYRAPRTIDGTLIIDLFEPTIYREPVLRLPRCPACGEISPTTDLETR